MVELASVIRPDDGVVWGQACAEPQTLVELFVAQRESFSGARVFLGASYSGLVKPEHADHLRFASYCGSGTNRALGDAGVLEIYPTPYSQLGALIRDGRIRADVVLVQVSPPNARGEYSLGLGVEYLAPALRAARAVIGEVNELVPWTHTELLLRRKDFALVVESSRAPVYLPYRSGEIEHAVARNAAEYIPDRAVIECGIGNLPNAVLDVLGERRGLRFHSGLIPDGVAALHAKGALTGEIRGGCLMGTQELFDWARENPQVRLHSSDYTHGAAVLAKLERFVAINSAVEVDLTGQVNAELARGSYVGAVGGALDFIRAANQSPGGVSLICVPSNRIVKKLSGPVATPRSEAAVIVTERGATDLRGCTLREREERLRAISENS
ncbi:MAG TPA: acetyl-CoA hydrolase/transferase C-terminal domain-containing protein [Burkholderiales bacterium]|nr:acetyl-CoA hydrolase/transferase C-terminal domain-containing protein [Burkholderiales bacterium]